MAREQREEFERRLLALVRDELDGLDETWPDGYEVTDFVVACRCYAAPEPGERLYPWEGGPYPGWYVLDWTRGSSPSYRVDAELLQFALEKVRDRMKRATDESANTESDEAAQDELPE